MELASLARFLQYAAASGLFGTAVFFIAFLPKQGDAAASRLGWPRPFLRACAIILLIGAALSLASQAAMMNGVSLSQLDWAAIDIVLTGTSWGAGIGARIGLGLFLLICLFTLPATQRLWWVSAVTGALIMISFAWTGHGAATEGRGAMTHLISDIAHLLAAALWIGALMAFLILLLTTNTQPAHHQKALYEALHGFSGMGTALVAVLVLSGVINSLFLIGLDRLSLITTSPYGLWLLAKLAIFIGMLVLAALNRFQLTPQFEGSLDHAQPGYVDDAVKALRHSLILETAAGMAVLVVVAVLGMLEPISAL
ncbi:copper homeostasis membrane protein CopD [Asticcacaulis endophyticus]|uniref:Copper resistance protein D domain-containing protein n=1 Tax=Asticcacaulis endophyticus TaxID=1395890 RepID=A0A918Q3Q7_9CAUL|nr:copper homeostasis membrane protein CopD [Asticcacaulis endophyticus]GGZ31179.1 hypothetical protein GCM10011273_17170 [Asticcacaulis endophyticus]